MLCCLPFLTRKSVLETLQCVTIQKKVTEQYFHAIYIILYNEIWEFLSGQTNLKMTFQIRDVKALHFLFYFPFHTCTAPEIVNYEPVTLSADMW